MPNPMNQPIGVRPVKTIELILSVIDANVWPGSMTGAFSVATSSSIECFQLVTFTTENTELLRGEFFDFRVWVAQIRQIRRSGPRVQIRQDSVIALL